MADLGGHRGPIPVMGGEGRHHHRIGCSGGREGQLAIQASHRGTDQGAARAREATTASAAPDRARPVRPGDSSRARPGPPERLRRARLPAPLGQAQSHTSAQRVADRDHLLAVPRRSRRRPRQRHRAGGGSALNGGGRPLRIPAGRPRSPACPWRPSTARHWRQVSALSAYPWKKTIGIAVALQLEHPCACTRPARSGARKEAETSIGVTARVRMRERRAGSWAA